MKNIHEVVKINICIQTVFQKKWKHSVNEKKNVMTANPPKQDIIYNLATAAGGQAEDTEFTMMSPSLSMLPTRQVLSIHKHPDDTAFVGQTQPKRWSLTYLLLYSLCWATLRAQLVIGTILMIIVDNH